MTPNEFKASLNQKINEIRLNFETSDTGCILRRPVSTRQIEARERVSATKYTVRLPLHQALDEFISF